MHLAVYTNARERAGAEVAVGNLLEALDPRFDVTVVGIDEQVTRWMASRRRGTDTMLVPPIPGKTAVGAMLTHRREVRALQPDIYQAALTSVWACQYELFAATTVRDVAVVAVEHSTFAEKGTFAKHALKRYVARRLAAHVAVGERTAREVESTAGLPNGSIRAIQNGVPELHGVPVPRASAGPVVGTLSRLDWTKGIDVLFSALPCLPEVTAVVVGKGDAEASLRAMAARMGVSDRVVFAGWTDQPGAWLQSFDVFVLPSRAEGLPLSICEAMLSGLPVVATAVGSVPEVVVDGTTGLVIPVDDPDALVRALQSLVSDPALRARMGEAGRERAARDFSVTSMVAQYEALYDEITDPHARALHGARR